MVRKLGVASAVFIQSWFKFIFTISHKAKPFCFNMFSIQKSIRSFYEKLICMALMAGIIQIVIECNGTHLCLFSP